MLNNLCALQPYHYVIIIAVAIVVLLIIVLAAISVHNRKNADTDGKVISSRADVNANVQAIEVLIYLAEGKPEMVTRLKTLQDKIKYLTPSSAKEVAAIDQKIYSALGDAKIELSKTKGESKSGKAEKYLERAELLIAERSAYTER
ncbi:MAG: hypothetical protein LUF82_03560 [Clostridia bacterium]|nr:hypothetical protein [Clostridia bacterium]